MRSSQGYGMGGGLSSGGSVYDDGMGGFGGTMGGSMGDTYGGGYDTLGGGGYDGSYGGNMDDLYGTIDLSVRGAVAVCGVPTRPFMGLLPPRVHAHHGQAAEKKKKEKKKKKKNEKWVRHSLLLAVCVCVCVCVSVCVCLCVCVCVCPCGTRCVSNKYFLVSHRRSCEAQWADPRHRRTAPPPLKPGASHYGTRCVLG